MDINKIKNELIKQKESKLKGNISYSPFAAIFFTVLMSGKIFIYFPPKKIIKKRP